MTEATMTKAALLEWAHEHADGPVVATPDYQLSLTSRLIRFPWMDGSAVGVGHDADGKTRINSVLDAVSAATGGVVHLLLGVGALGPADPALREHLGAIGTLLGELRGGPEVRVWTLAAGEEPQPFYPEPAAFTSDTPQRWAKMLISAAAAPVGGMAADVAAALADRPSFALYPKLSSLASQTPWQMRLDGLEIGRTGPDGTTLRLASTDISKPGQPREVWLSVVGSEPLHFASNEVAKLAALVDRLIAAWTDPESPGAVLCHGQAEHALEAHLLSGRLVLDTWMAGTLRPAVPFRNGTLAAAQFPTLWGDVTRPARYLDALLADDAGRPWAVELKDQAAGGGHGAYLRHGIGQAVLYRHYIRSAPALDGWFETHGMQRKECQAALAFPKATASTEPVIKKLKALAALFGVEVIEFPRPA